MARYRLTRCVAVALGAFVAELPAQVSRPDSVPIVLSASGGISAGSYQGGANYALIETLRRARSRRIFPDSLPKYYLATAAGASAGNINALLAALSWCAKEVTVDSARADTIAAEQSPFWATWVNLGIGQLLPENLSKTPGETEKAVFDRSFTRSVTLGMLKRFVNGATAINDCNVPVGLTLTKLIPFEFAVTPGLYSKAQRMATMFTTTSKEGRIVFGMVEDSIRRRGSLGTVILSPDIYGAPASDSTKWEAVFKAVTASSAFPIAFGTSEFCYVPADPSRATEKGEKCQQFLDGGAFDNNPFALAIGMFKDPKPAGPDSSTIILAYSNPGQRRGRLVEPPPPDPRAQSGLGGLLQLVAGFYPSARQYELQLLGRQLARDKELLNQYGDPQKRPRAVEITFTTRAAPIYGDRIGAFAGFLGRPWREYDFYAGVYDGLQYVASRLLCRLNDTVCTAREHRRLIDQNVLGLSSFALALLQAHAQLEYAPNSPTPLLSRSPAIPSNGGQIEKYRALLVASSFDAITQLRPNQALQECKLVGIIGGIFCADSIGSVITTLRGNNDVREAAAFFARVCGDDRDVERRSQCPADKEFNTLLRNPTKYVDDLAERALARLEIAEDAILKEARMQRPGERVSKGQSALVELAYLVYRSRNYNARYGFKFNPSSARHDWSGSRIATLVGDIAPHYVMYELAWDSAGANRVIAGDERPKRGLITAGWVPSVFLGRNWRIVSPLALAFHTSGRRGEHSSREYRLGAGLRFGDNAPRVSGFQLAAVLKCERVFRRDQECEDNPTLELSNTYAFNKIRLAAAWNPRTKVRQFSAGIADINGMLYWWFR